MQSYSQFLIPNPADTTNILLAELILLQFNTSTTVSRSVSAVAYPSISETGQAHWVNGLWFAALVCSLSSALVSMLAKQWLVAYLPSTSGPLRSRARARQSRFMQLEAWHVPTIINALPMLLHVALLLFFAGLIVLLWSSDLGITLSTLCIVAFAYCFYVASIVLPMFVLTPLHFISAHLTKSTLQFVSRLPLSASNCRTNTEMDITKVLLHLVPGTIWMVA